MPSGSTGDDYSARPLGRSFFERPVAEVARDLLGVWLLSTVDGVLVGGPIVETEAYDEDDPASHSHTGRTARNAIMFGPAGRLYVYRSYGIHWCMNVVTGPEGQGAAVLLRAVDPQLGRAHMAARRGLEPTARDLTRGPGRLTQALGVDDRLQGHALRRIPLRLAPSRSATRPAVLATPRIGISKATQTPWRFVVADHPAVSGPRRLRVP